MIVYNEGISHQRSDQSIPIGTHTISEKVSGVIMIAGSPVGTVMQAWISKTTRFLLNSVIHIGVSTKALIYSAN